MQCSAARPTGSASAAVRPLSSSTRWNACGPSPGVTPVHVDVYGFIRSPVDERGSSCRNTSRSRQVGHDLLDAHHGDQRLGQGQAHPPVALGLDDEQRAGLGDGEVGAGDRRPWRARNLLPQVRAGGHRPAAAARRSAPGPRRASRAGRSRGSPRGCGGWPAPGCATAGRRRAGRSARRGRSPWPRCPAASSASLSPISWVAIDLTLTTSVCAGGAHQSVTIAVGLVGVAGPVHDAAAGGDLLPPTARGARRGGPSWPP